MKIFAALVAMASATNYNTCNYNTDCPNITGTGTKCAVFWGKYYEENGTLDTY